MYLPHDIPNAKVLITVKTYPNPSRKYGELVCNAGFLETGEWVRIYPIKFRQLPFEQQYSKFNWIQVDLIRRKGDLRLESYQPRLGIDDEISILDSMSTGKNRDWAERKVYALREVFTSMNVLIEQAKTPGTWKSLATVKPKKILDFQIERVDDRVSRAGKNVRRIAV